MFRRIFGWLFGCSHHDVVYHDAYVAIARCQRRAWHSGQHRYPFGLEP